MINDFLNFVGEIQPVGECKFSSFIIGQPVKVEEGYRIDLGIQISHDYHTYNVTEDEVVGTIVQLFKERKGAPMQHNDYLAIDLGSDIVAKSAFLGEANRILCTKKSLENVIQFHQDNNTVEQFTQYYKAFVLPDGTLEEDEYIVLLNSDYAKCAAFDYCDGYLHIVLAPTFNSLCQFVKRRGLYMGEMPK